jgi:hypothetical protein
MLKQKSVTEQVWPALLHTAKSRSKYFGKHGERFDRRLYAEIESINRISLLLHSKGVIDADPENYRSLVAIQRDLLNRGQELYEAFP